MKMHYLPQWLLHQFREKGLTQINVSTGEVRGRSPDTGGYLINPWEEDIERGLMGIHDDKASKIFYKYIKGKNKIILPPAPRLEFAK